MCFYQKDAGAKHVEVKLKEFGADLIEVSDNGSGVSPSNYEGLALKYHTSKLATFSDLTGVKSFGFRGEALSSLCELAGSFSVTTRTASESVGVKLTYGRNGKLLGKVWCGVLCSCCALRRTHIHVCAPTGQTLFERLQGVVEMVKARPVPCTVVRCYIRT